MLAPAKDGFSGIAIMKAPAYALYQVAQLPNLKTSNDNENKEVNKTTITWLNFKL